MRLISNMRFLYIASCAYKPVYTVGQDFELMQNSLPACTVFSKSDAGLKYSPKQSYP